MSQKDVRLLIVHIDNTVEFIVNVDVTQGVDDKAFCSFVEILLLIGQTPRSMHRLRCVAPDLTRLEQFPTSRDLLRMSFCVALYARETPSCRTRCRALR